MKRSPYEILGKNETNVMQLFLANFLVSMQKSSSSRIIVTA